MKIYVIWNPKNNLYWSNDSGWVDIYDADCFDAHERMSLIPPVDGKWVLEGGFDESKNEENNHDAFCYEGN